MSIHRVLHVLNYGYPYIDGYAIRSAGLVTAQQEELGLQVAVATSPYSPLTSATDPQFVTPAWGNGEQLVARQYSEQTQPFLLQLERPDVGFSPYLRQIFYQELHSIVQRLEPDVIHAHHPHYVGSVALQAAREQGLPFVYEVRCFNGDYDLDRLSPYHRLRGYYRNHLEKQVCRQADRVVTISEGLAHRIRNMGVEKNRVYVVRNSINTRLFSPQNQSSKDENTLTVGYATTFSGIEGLDIFVKSIPKVQEALEKQGKQLRVRLAGKGIEWEQINALVDQLQVRDIVELPGFIPYSQMPAFYESLDLFVVPRRTAVVAQDTTPLKPLEAVAMGLPLLVSDLPAMRELLGQGEGVRFFEPKPEALAQALLNFAQAPWQGNPKLAKERTWEQEIYKYQDIYETAVRENNASEANNSSRWKWATVKEEARSRTKQWLREATDRGWFGRTPLQQHVVICGFPRAGSTLLQLMLYCCLQEDLLAFDEEVPALSAAANANRNHAYMMTKLPDDIFNLNKIREYYQTHFGNCHFLLCIRDPRAVLTSQHQAYPKYRGYYVSCERWQNVYEALKACQWDSDVTLIYYEQLIKAPEKVEATLRDRLGWRFKHPLSEYYQIAATQGIKRDSMTEGALGGLRPLDPTRLEPWRHPEHRQRLQEVLQAIPDFPDHLIEMGYESNTNWVNHIL